MKHRKFLTAGLLAIATAMPLAAFADDDRHEHEKKFQEWAREDAKRHEEWMRESHKRRAEHYREQAKADAEYRRESRKKAEEYWRERDKKEAKAYREWLKERSKRGGYYDDAYELVEYVIPRVIIGEPRPSY